MYFVTSVKLDYKYDNNICHCWGYMPELKDAMLQIQLDNYGNLFRDGRFDYLVIESKQQGFCNKTENEWWYNWSDEYGWTATSKPDILHNVVNFGIG